MITLKKMLAKPTRTHAKVTVFLFIAGLSFHEYKLVLNQAKYTSQVQSEENAASDDSRIHLINSIKLSSTEAEKSKLNSNLQSDEFESLRHEAGLKADDEQSFVNLKKERSNYFLFQLGRKVTPF